MEDVSVTCRSPVNIAVVKYWGKRDEKLILPINSSLSITLGLEELCATTTVHASPSFAENRFWLNGCEQPLNKRMNLCLQQAQESARKEDSNRALINWKVHVCSENNFPTAAGLASSAAGFAGLAFSLSQLYDLHGDTSTIARQGSGSACRSVLGGFVKWEMGQAVDGTDSCAVQVENDSHWPELEVLILVVNDQQKETSSTVGMQTSVETSHLLKHRAECLVPRVIQEIEQAIHEKDFPTFARITMQDSNQFHAVCLDTSPPIFYLNDTSKQIIKMVTQLNKFYRRPKAAYTFDAGPNAVLFVLREDIPLVLHLIQHFFPPSPTAKDGFLRGQSSSTQSPCHQPDKALLNEIRMLPQEGALKFVIHTKVGVGPNVLPPSSSLLDSTGQPRIQSS